MKSLLHLINKLFESYFDEVMLFLDIWIIILPVSVEVKLLILLVKHIRKKTDI